MSEVSVEVETLRREVVHLQRVAATTERRLRAHHAVSRVLGEETSVEAAMPRILAALGTALDSTLAAFWVRVDDLLEVRTTWSSDAANAGRWQELCRHERFAEEVGLPGRVWRDRGPAWISDVTGETRLPRLAGLIRLGVTSAIGVPIMLSGDVLGVIELLTDRVDSIDDTLVEVLRTVGAQLGQFVSHVRAQERLRSLYAEAQVTARELDRERAALAKINELGRQLTVELDERVLVDSITAAATELTGAQFGAFFHNVTDDRGDKLTLYALSGAPHEAFEKLPLPRWTHQLGPAIAGIGPVRVDDVMVDPLGGKPPIHPGPPGALQVRSLLAVPVVVRAGAILGALFFGHERAAVFDDRAQRIALDLAAHAATAVDNARLHADAHRLIAALEKTNAELDQFAYIASHDLRAPLRGIANLAMWIEEDLGAAVPPKVVEQLALLKNRAARMDTLITGLLELARVGRVRQRPQRVDVTELLHETIDLLSPPPEARVLIIGAMPTIVTDRLALQQVFLNLIANALQHAERPDVTVRITAREGADEVELCVSDDGVGIPAEHHERVWQLFQTLQLRDATEATGTGLSIVRKQVDSAGGQAWIDPAVREGATLRFTWPKRPRA